MDFSKTRQQYSKRATSHCLSDPAPIDFQTLSASLISLLTTLY
jgi:hypothetical protein